MNKKMMSAWLIVAMVIGMPVSIQANDIDQQIKDKQEQLKRQEQSVMQNEQALQKYTAEQESVTQRMRDLERVMTQTQQEMDALMQEMSALELLMHKREESIKDQARQVQVLNQADYLIEAIFSAESIVEVITQLFTAAELTSHATDMLAQQQKDKELLEEKQVVIENKTAAYVVQRQELTHLQNTLSDAVREAEIARVSLALETAQTQEDITRLTQQKEEVERQKEKALEEERQRQEIQRRVAEQERAATVTKTTTAVTPAASTVTPAVSTSQTGFIYPLANPTVTSGFGVARQLTLLNGSSYSDIHNGIDYVNGDSAAPIVAVADGVVVWAGTDSSGGVGVIIKHDNGLYTHYWHLSSLMVSSGATVTQGQQIGVIGKTGLATGIHLHFGVSTQMYSGYVNPALYVG